MATTKRHVDIPKALAGLGEALAYVYGFRYSDRGSLNKLIVSILTGEWLLVPSAKQWNPEKLVAIQQVLLDFRDKEVRRQPFELLYLSAAGNYHQYSVLYAEVVRHEDRLFLDCWVKEVDETRVDFKPLAHNRSLRIDRIEKIGRDLPVQWRRTGLDRVDVTLQIQGKLVSSFRKQTGDEIVKQAERLVVSRSITSAFLFEQEILRYGRDCVVMAPEPLRDRMRATIEAMVKNYE